MDREKIREIITGLLETIRGTDVEEVEVESEGMRVRIKRRERGKKVVRDVEKAPQESALEEAEVQDMEEEWENCHIVRSPFVGTFYRAPSPGAQPFVEVGDSVKKGQVLCIVEAMKIMNEVECDVSGRVVHVFVKNGEPVEYNQPLFAIEAGE